MRYRFATWFVAVAGLVGLVFLSACGSSKEILSPFDDGGTGSMDSGKHTTHDDATVKTPDGAIILHTGDVSVMSCKPKTCADLKVGCGEQGDGCGNLLMCGTCTAPETCGGGGVPNTCGMPEVSDAGDGSIPTGTLSIAPLNQTFTVPYGTSAPAATYTAKAGTVPVSASFSIDLGQIASINASTGVLTPSGVIGGVAHVTASFNGQTVSTPVTIVLTSQNNGAPAAGDAGADAGNAGGNNGVGGSPAGGPVAMATQTILQGTPVADPSLVWLYPYNNTVWPRGMLAPLLMWSWAPGDADAIQIELSTQSGSFSWTGTFGPPAILTQTGGHFIRQPIPQDVWNMATNTAGAVTAGGTTDGLVLKLTVEKAGVASGPLTQTWPVAPARLTGTVYYNSYGTQLVKNWASTDKAGHPVGAAILGIQSGQTGPSLVVGQNSPLGSNGVPTDDSGCRVCHVVSSHGRWLLTQSEQGSPGDGQSFLYDLSAANVQGSAVMIPTQGTFAWAAMVGDGSYALTNSIDPSSTNPAITGSLAGSATSSFWQFAPTPATTAGTLTGLPAGVAVGYPSYAPDDKLLAYIDVTGHTQSFGEPTSGMTPTTDLLNVASYSAATQTFSNVRTIAAPTTATRIGYPVFLPDDSGLLFETEVRTSQSDSVMVTRNGARSELWWVALGGPSPTPVRLDTLNGIASGTSYLPTGPNNHGTSGATDPQSSYSEVGYDDTTLNYEPTVLPVVAGGYAWVVFTSRRLYGSQLTDVPWLSWPPDYDITDLGTATVKKLWVAAIDLNAPASSDISHPAFYLPAQEILAGNSRGFFVLDPCGADGQSCVTGDQCCNGYCEAGDGGSLVCSSATAKACAGVEEKCKTPADCCDTTNSCTDGFCAVQSSK